MSIFYGAAIQGNRDRSARQHVHQAIIQAIKSCGFKVLSEHAGASGFTECAELLEQSLGSLPPPGKARTAFVRNKMVKLLEGDISAAIFEVSVPSLGTGVEIAHAYLRPRLGLTEIPILALYEEGYWPHGLSAMIDGLPAEQFPNFILYRYTRLEEAREMIGRFLNNIRSD